MPYARHLASTDYEVFRVVADLYDKGIIPTYAKMRDKGLKGSQVRLIELRNQWYEDCGIEIPPSKNQKDSEHHAKPDHQLAIQIREETRRPVTKHVSAMTTSERATHDYRAAWMRIRGG